MKGAATEPGITRVAVMLALLKDAHPHAQFGEPHAANQSGNTAAYNSHIKFKFIAHVAGVRSGLSRKILDYENVHESKVEANENQPGSPGSVSQVRALRCGAETLTD